jgi:hypothetical protein
MGTPTVTWDTTFENSPAGSDDPRAADDRMREIKLASRERAEREHGGGTSEAIARHGVHKKGSARASYATGDPTTVPDGSGTRALNSTDDDGRLHVDATSKFLRVYDGSAWQYPIADGGVHLKKINIGDWNMDSTGSVAVAHGLTFSKIVGVQAYILNDAGTELRLLTQSPTTPTFDGSWVGIGNPLYLNIRQTLGGTISVGATNVTLSREGNATAVNSNFWGPGIVNYITQNVISGIFDTVNYDSTGYNRGWIFVWYTD